MQEENKKSNLPLLPASFAPNTVELPLTFALELGPGPEVQPLGLRIDWRAPPGYEGWLQSPGPKRMDKAFIKMGHILSN